MSKKKDSPSQTFGEGMLSTAVRTVTETVIERINNAKVKKLLPAAGLALETAASAIASNLAATADAPHPVLTPSIDHESAEKAKAQDIFFVKFLNFLSLVKDNTFYEKDEARPSQPTAAEKARYTTIDNERSSQRTSAKDNIYIKAKVRTKDPEIDKWLKANQFPSGPNVRTWWDKNGVEFADSNGHPDLSWLKPQQLEKLRQNELLVGANLEFFNLSRLDLSDINLQGANLSRACMKDTQIFYSTNLKQALTLNTDFSEAQVRISLGVEQLYGDKARELLSLHPTALAPTDPRGPLPGSFVVYESHFAGPEQAMLYADPKPSASTAPIPPHLIDTYTLAAAPLPVAETTFEMVDKATIPPPLPPRAHAAHLVGGNGVMVERPSSPMQTLIEQGPRPTSPSSHADRLAATTGGSIAR